MTDGQIGLLTGAIGAGKTTAAARAIELARQQGLACGGLLAPALLDSRGRKTGIWGVDLLTGQRRVLASTEQALGGPAIGPYSFDAAALAWAIKAINAAAGQCNLVIVDEIGRLELEAGSGLAPILPLLAGEETCAWLAIVRESLLVSLQDRLDSLRSLRQRVFTLTIDNREALPARIAAFYSNLKLNRRRELNG